MGFLAILINLLSLPWLFAVIAIIFGLVLLWLASKFTLVGDLQKILGYSGFFMIVGGLGYWALASTIQDIIADKKILAIVIVGILLAIMAFILFSSKFNKNSGR